MAHITDFSRMVCHVAINTCTASSFHKDSYANQHCAKSPGTCISTTANHNTTRHAKTSSTHYLATTGGMQYCRHAASLSCRSNALASAAETTKIPAGPSLRSHLRKQPTTKTHTPDNHMQGFSRGQKALPRSKAAGVGGSAQRILVLHRQCQKGCSG